MDSQGYLEWLFLYPILFGSWLWEVPWNPCPAEWSVDMYESTCGVFLPIVVQVPVVSLNLKAILAQGPFWF